MEGVEGLVRFPVKRKYIIFAETNGKSFGQRTLYKMRDELENQGFDAKILCYGKQVGDKSIFVNSLRNYDKNKDIVVYPEIIEGNPLGFRNVVRYLLQDPEYWGMTKDFDKREMIFAFDDICCKNVPYLRFDIIDRKLFYDAHLSKDVNCYFIYKGGKFREVPEIKGWTEINIHWPEKKEDLAKLLQRTEYLYSYDDRSMLLLEAKICGAKVKIITQNSIEDYTREDEFDTDTLKTQLEYFIAVTQNTNTLGNINTQGTFSTKDWIVNKISRFLIRILYIFSHSKSLKKMLKSSKLYRHCGCVFMFKRKKCNV